MNINDLTYEPVYVYDKLTDVQKGEMEELCVDYRRYLDRGNTE